MDEATSFWILELNVSTSCSRLSIGSSFCRRSRTEMVSSSFCRSSRLRFRFAGDQIREMAGMFGVQRGDFDLVGQRRWTSWRFPRTACARCAAWPAARRNPPFRRAAIRSSRADTARAARNSLTRMRQSPSTSTRTVPSGNFTIFDRRETQPTSYKSSGAGSATSGLRCSTAPNSRSPATMSSISLRLGPVSTSSGTTVPGKITMSDRPRMGSDVRQRTRGDARRRVRIFGGAQDADKFCLRRCHRRSILVS